MRTRRLRTFIFTTLLPTCALGILLWVGVVLAETSTVYQRIQMKTGGEHHLLTPPALLTCSLQFSSISYSAGEGDGSVTIIVNRSGDESAVASVDFKTVGGTASDRTDYTLSLGTLYFAAGEQSKSFDVLITDDGSVEGGEIVTLILSNPQGASLGDLSTSTLSLVDNDTATSPSNPIDQTAVFVRQHYHDFLNREPEPGGYQGWQDVLNNCGLTIAQPCDRIEVSSAFFRSSEFQQRGYFVYRFYSASFGRVPRYTEFMRDMSRVSGFQSAEQEEASRVAFITDFKSRQEFKNKYDALLDPRAYVEALEAAAGIILTNRETLIADLAAGRKTRAQVLRAVAESLEVYQKYYNQAFVVMQYFGYLRRDPDILYLSWIDVLNRTGDYRIMVNGFMNSLEYRSRFFQDPPSNRAPTVNAGTDQMITLPATVSLSGAVSDDGLPLGSSLSILWSVVSGPGVVNFGSPTSATTTASFTVPGTYVLKLTASDTLLASEDTMSVIVNPRNLPPEVNAGALQTIEMPAIASLSGTVSDDNLPQGSTLSVNWVKTSGPGVVSFANASSAHTTASFSAPGTYALRLSVSDTEFLVSDQVIITVHPQNQPPAISAGPDQTIRVTHGADLSGFVNDDGWPQGSAVTALWSKVSGPGVVRFRDVSKPVTVATFSTVGTYVLRLTANDSRLSSSDEVTITVQPALPGPVVYAGPDQEITFPAIVALNGTATGDGSGGSPFITTWTKVSGPGSVTFADIHKPVTTCSVEVPGTYVLRLTADDGQYVNSDDVTITVRQGFVSRVYTLDADFDEGSLINVRHNIPNQLHLDDTTRAFNFIWVAVSSQGTIVKIDTETGAVLGEYRTAPQGQQINPSRTTVDHNGSVWTTNRDGNSVVRIGLLENGQCVDRNGNGVIETSNALGDVRGWPNGDSRDTDGGVETADDECIINYVRVHSSGTRHVSVDSNNDVWVSGTGGQIFDLIDGKTGLIKRTEPSVGYGGYGGLIDRFGVIWSARPLLRWDTSKPLTGPNSVNWIGYGHDSYGLCIDSHGNVWNTELGGRIYKFRPDGALLGLFHHGGQFAQGCVVGKDDDVWVAHSLYLNTVGHLKNDGTFVGNVTVGSGPTGVAVDAFGKIWATNHYSQTVSRINPQAGPIGADGATRVGEVDFTTVALGGNLYNYSDMTGSTLTGAPGEGTWSTVFDSGLAGAEWGRIGWTARICGDGSLIVTVASSQDGTTFSPAETVTSGADPSVPNGRYLKINVSFRRAASGESPVLYDLSVGTQGFTLPTSTNVAPEVDAGQDQTITLPNAATLNGSACDDALPSGNSLAVTWEKMSGPGIVTFANPNSLHTDATFSADGTYVLSLTASDGQFSASDAVTITVNAATPGNQPPTVNAGNNQTITLPENAMLNGTVSDDGLPQGGALTIQWSKLSGAGSVTFGSQNQAATSASFSAAGTYVLQLQASDTQFTSSDTVVINVNSANQPPSVNAGVDQTITLGATANLNGTATDDGLPSGSTLVVSWSQIIGPGTATFQSPGQAATTATFSAQGQYVLRLTANDSQLTSTDDVLITVNAAEPMPIVSIASPIDESELTTRTSVVGSVSGGTWKLEYSLTGDEGVPTVWMTFANGNGGVSNVPLGIFDPTLLLNGRYLIRLSAANAAGQTAQASVSVVVNEEQKVGNFSITFSDLSVPVAGLPIEVTRTYDSRDKRIGDFGVGWTLGIRNVRLQESRAMGAKWLGEVSSGFVPNYCITPAKPHIVTITLADSRVYKFEAVINENNGCQLGAPLQEVTIGFRPLPGTQGSLVAVGANEPLIVPGPFPGAFDLLDGNTVAAADYDQYQLTLENGTVLLIDQQAGLQRMTDTNSNTLTIIPGGIIHSSGKSITFTRDILGRITQITDPAGNSMSYAYDANGDLTSFQDREGNTTNFTYNSTHGLLTINDPRGIQPLRNEYDAEGRLIKQIDAFGREVKFTHDLNARQEIVFDRLGRATVYDYDARGNVLRVQDTDGKIITLTYDARDNLLTETNALGKTVTYTYDAQDNRLSETDALGNTTSYTYNARKQPLTITDPAGGVTTYTYDANGNQTSVKDALGNTTSATYAANALQLTNTDALGNTTSFEYDASGNLTKQIDPLGNATTYTYDTNGNRLTESQTRIVVGVIETLTTTFQYDKLGRQTKVIYPDGSTIETVYNSIGKQSATIDQLGHQTSYEYDAMGQLIRTVYPDGTEEKFEYDFEGRRTKSIDRAGRATTYLYDSLGRLEKITFPDGSITTNTYDAIGQVGATTNALSQITRYEYDAAGRRTKIIDALGNATIFGYDVKGNQISMKDANGHITSYVYDANNRQTQIIFPDNTTETTVYDKLGQVTAKIDQAGKQTTYEYDKRGKLTKVTDALGGVTTYTYDEQGNQLTQTDANNHTTSYSYDRMGRRTKRTLPLSMSETYAYDLAGNLTSRTDFRGKTTTFAHDVMNRVLSKTPDASLGETAVTFAYTVTGQRKTMTDASGTTNYIYDPRDRLVSKATPQGTLSYTYDGASNLKTVRSSNANGVTINYSYDTLNRLSTVNDNRLSGGTTTYTYDLNGNLESTTYPNEVRTTYNYDNLNRLKNINAAKGATLASYAYTLGAAGNRLSVIEADGRAVNYTYDALYRLTGETISNDTIATNNGSINYTYDAVGNRLKRTSTVVAIPSTDSTYDANDRLTTDTYDANGNTTVSNGNAYQYNFENRLTSLNGGAVTFVYDGDGNRVAKTVGGVTIKYLVDTNNHTGHAQVVEELVSSSVRRTYTYGHDLISQTQLINNTWTTHFYGYDGHGSVRYLTDTAGVITDTYTYDAFGHLIASTGTTPNDYLYSGEQFDGHLGFYYLRARYMNTDSGRFWTQDTYEGVKEDPSSLHKYLYTNADPVNNVDPSGHFSIFDFSLGSTLSNLLSIGGRVSFSYARVKAVVKTGVAFVAAAYLTRNLIFNRRKTNEGFIAKANLSSLPENDWPDIEIEGRVSGDPEKLVALVIRTEHKGIKGRLLITSSSISGNGGVNFNIFTYDVVGFAKFKVDLALRVGTGITGPNMTQLGAIFEFKADFVNSFASVTARTSVITFGSEGGDLTDF